MIEVEKRCSFIAFSVDYKEELTNGKKQFTQ